MPCRIRTCSFIHCHGYGLAGRSQGVPIPMDEQTGEFRSCVRIECGCVIGWRFSILKISWKFQEDSKSISACPPNPCPVPQLLAEALTHYVATGNSRACFTADLDAERNGSTHSGYRLAIFFRFRFTITGGERRFASCLPP